MSTATSSTSGSWQISAPGDAVYLLDADLTVIALRRRFLTAGTASQCSLAPAGQSKPSP